jgi:putative membrane-bound dehydrogenase-like protein
MMIWRGTHVAALTCLLALTSFATSSRAADSSEAQWIWAPPEMKAGVCYFRKAFQLPEPEAAVIEITADSQYELFLNGARIGGNNGWNTLERYDLTPRLSKGRNILAVKASNADGGPAGLVGRLTVRAAGGTDVAHSTDTSWRVSATESPGWQRPRFDDRRWVPAHSLGELNVAAPWGDKVRAAGGGASGRFSIRPEFRVERVVAPVHTGSLVAMTFNERGEILASRERGPILLISDANADGIVETTEVFSEQVTGCQGLLALNGNVYAVGEGPEGPGFYLLPDANDDRRADGAQLLFKFQGGMGEHGPHAPVLGPDGRIYLMVGNHSMADARFKATSPYRYFYEGDLAFQRYEDPTGHANKLRAPGGVILRTTLDGAAVEVFCGGFRNAYDLAFNRQGDLFTFDSDMERDIGLPWYRPTRVCFCVPGGEFGWRSGWANWPSYYYDALPPTLECGRGSPTGVEFYNHFRFPEKYRNAMFACDWSRGRILAIHLKQSGAHYVAEEETFLEGRPLNVTDIGVGPDGWLYFTTGGRGTEGGVYRIVALQPGAMPKVEPGLMQAIYQPQMQSAWARNAVAGVVERMGPQWNAQIAAIAAAPNRPAFERTRALELMQLVGPSHTPAMLVKLTADSNAEVRAKAAMYLGQTGNEAGDQRLVELLQDADPLVRRRACEALVDRDKLTDVNAVIPLLKDRDRSVRWAAGRLLERQPPEKWQSIVLDSKEPRVFLEGAACVVRSAPTASAGTLVLMRCSDWLEQQLSDPDFLDLLRLTEIAYHRTGANRDLVPELPKRLNAEYPTLDPTLNRELIRLLAYLQESALADRALEHIKSNAPLEDRLQTGLFSTFVAAQWLPPQRQQLLEFLETARQQPYGESYEGYIDNITRDLMLKLTPEARLAIVDHATTTPSAALHALRGVGVPDEALTAKLIQLDEALAKLPSGNQSVPRLRTGITATLSISTSPTAMPYLRELFARDPQRRAITAMGLAEQPDGENWPLLVQALNVAEGDPARYLLEKLTQTSRKPEKPEAIRQAILCGLRLGDQGGKLAIPLLVHWTGASASAPNEPWPAALAKWQTWYREKYPDELDPAPPIAQEGSKWSTEELLEYLASDEAKTASAERGAAIFEKATCIKCHRYGSRGEGIGPDLSTVSQRFQKKELLESVLHPSHVISDQYAAKTVQTKDGLSYTGIVADQGTDSIVVLDQQAKKTVIPKDQIEATAAAKLSAMPEGLFNALTQEEIADLLAYLASPAK